MNDIDKVEDLANSQVTATMDADTYAMVAAVLTTWCEDYPHEKDFVQAIGSIKWEKTR
jgi:hypothetical protein